MFNINQGDRFSPSFIVNTFNTKEEAEQEANKMQSKSIIHDAYTSFWIEEVV